MAQNKSMMASKTSSRLPSNKTRAISALLKEAIASQPTKKKPFKSSAHATLAPFAGVSEIGLAPVTIGNTVRGVKQTVLEHRNGVRVIGRDFVMAVGGTSSGFSNWTLQAGFGLSPICLNATGLRGYFQTYERYRWNAANVHYITSSPTSATGDVLVTYHANHGGPKVDHTSTNFMSYALSTDSSLLGPQWTNHTVQLITGSRDFFLTDILSAEDVMHQADGEVLIYTRNTTQAGSPDQPGYILIDYDVVFERRMLNPRVQSLPSSLFKWTPQTFHYNGGPVVAGATVSFDLNASNTYSGVAAVVPSGTVAGDIFQVVCDVQNATFLGGVAPATMFSVVISTGVTLTYPVGTGTTLYAVCGSASGFGSFALYPNYDAALADQALVWTSAGSPNVGFPMIFTCVGSVTPAFAQANIG